MTNNPIKNRYEISFFIQAVNANPNGDPDAENLPRVDDETGHGLITAEAIKRKVRNYVATAFDYAEGHDIIMREATNINKAILEVKNKETSDKSAAEVACERFFDVRTFGGVLSTGANAGQVKGPVQVSNGESLDEVNVNDITLDRVCVAKKPSGGETIAAYEEWDKTTPDDEKRTFGRKSFVSYGLYRVNVSISANLALKTGFSEDDFDLLLESILMMYNEASSSKMGVSVVGPIILFRHNVLDENPRSALLGCTSAQKLFDSIRATKVVEGAPRCHTDYDVSIIRSDIPKGVSVGFKSEPFEPVVWDNVPNSENWVRIVE